MRRYTVGDQLAERSLRANVAGTAEYSTVKAPFPLRISRRGKPKYRPVPGSVAEHRNKQQCEDWECSHHLLLCVETPSRSRASTQREELQIRRTEMLPGGDSGGEPSFATTSL